MRVYDLVVIGAGGLGSAVLRAAARRGWDVVGLEQFGAAHDRGSSHGQSRIIRAAYFEHPHYAPMAQRAFAMWRELAMGSRRDILEITGLIQIGVPESSVIRGVLRSARQHQLAVEQCSADEIERRWPAFKVPAEMVGVFEPGAGILRVENAVAQTLAAAKSCGAQLLSNSRVTGWEANDAGLIRVTTNQQTLTARRMVIAAGAWANQMLALNSGTVNPLWRFQVLRKQQNWFQVDRADIHRAAGFPCFLVDEPQGCFYGFPQLDLLGMKIAEHSGGQPVNSADELDRRELENDVERSRQFAQLFFRFSKLQLSRTSTCMYTMSVDQHFVADLHPQLPQVAILAGMSGHGFKFAPVLGEQAVRLLEGQGFPECEFLRASRPVTIE